MELLQMDFNFLGWKIPVLVFIIIFILVALLCVSLYLYLLFKKSRRVVDKIGNVDSKELKRIESFEKSRDNFEQEIAKVKKIRRNNK